MVRRCGTLERQELIHSKGFAMGNNYIYNGTGNSEDIVNYNKIKVGVKTLEDAIYNLGDLVKNGNRNLANKGAIMKALADNDLEVLRQVSNYFYKTNGIY
jgi:hypothetical protein